MLTLMNWEGNSIFWERDKKKSEEKHRLCGTALAIKKKQLSCASKANKTLDLVVLKLENEIALKNERLNLKLMDCLTESENTTGMDKAISDLDSVTGIQGSILNYERNFEDN